MIARCDNTWSQLREGVHNTAHYRRNVQQYLLIAIGIRMEPGILNDAKMREEVKYLIKGEEHWDSVSFYVASMSWSIFGRLIMTLLSDLKALALLAFSEKQDLSLFLPCQNRKWFRWGVWGTRGPACWHRFHHRILCSWEWRQTWRQRSHNVHCITPVKENINI